MFIIIFSEIHNLVNSLYNDYIYKYRVELEYTYKLKSGKAE